MEYKEFVEYIKMNAGYIAGEGGNITINHVIKNNGCEMDGLVIMEKGKDIAPTIYLDSLYELYTNGENIKSIIRQIELIYEQNKNNVTFDVNILKHFDTIKDKIVYKVVNYRSNEKLLEQVPHKRILDLAVVFYCLLDNEYGRSATALIYNNNLKNWNVTIDDVYKAALKNTPDLLHSKISSMAALFEKCGVNVDGEEVDLKDYVPSDMYVLTNESKLNGAACILYENVLYDFAQKLGADLYILPSSVHEVILLPKLSVFEKDELVNMVKEVNTEGVAADEVLSDHVYEYNRTERLITM
ncbi:DUF5688 family protein [Lachnospira eligens]|jgi:hypothetical protein|uniref:DUF5688 family protein n=1 Tax=Lachnospira eligens TaxID=39485 RepID=UPI000E5CF771|nr:DUF5688 family protein [Lachnospira eligens]RGZ72815.1 hypothetical protein DW976_02105 [Lachnospira eligens]HBA10341.1 hypothetical protein [Eubacterium sp.]